MSPATPPPFPPLQIPEPLAPFVHWFAAQPVLTVLLSLIVLDFASGFFLGIVRKGLSSTISWRGASKKAITVLIVMAAGVMNRLIPDYPVLNTVAAFYSLTEALSILENAAAAGIPLPSGLVETLAKLREQQRFVASQKMAPPATLVNIITPPGYKPLDEDHSKAPQAPQDTTTTATTTTTTQPTAAGTV